LEALGQLGAERRVLSVQQGPGRAVDLGLTQCLTKAP
jgi:hypothetical protein